MAAERNLDLVLISEPNSKLNLPVCRLINYDHFRFSKKNKISKTKQKNVLTKEMTFSPNIQSRDYEIKLRKIEDFLNEGHKVKVVLRFRGKEVIFKEKGMQLLQKLKDDLSEISKLMSDNSGTQSHRQMVLLFEPIKRS